MSDDNNIELMKVRLLGSPLWEWVVGALVIWILVANNASGWTMAICAFFLAIAFNIGERLTGTR